MKSLDDFYISSISTDITNLFFIVILFIIFFTYSKLINLAKNFVFFFLNLKVFIFRTFKKITNAIWIIHFNITISEVTIAFFLKIIHKILHITKAIQLAKI